MRRDFWTAQGNLDVAGRPDQTGPDRTIRLFNSRKNEKDEATVRVFAPFGKLFRQTEKGAVRGWRKLYNSVFQDV